MQAHGDGSYDVLLQDGDLHRHVDVDDIRVDQEARNRTDGFSDGDDDSASEEERRRRSHIPRGQFGVHQRVEVNYEGMGRYFRGRIDQAYSNGTYDIKWVVFVGRLLFLSLFACVVVCCC